MLNQTPMSIQIQDLQIRNKMVSMKITIFHAVKCCSCLMFWTTCCLHFQGPMGSDSWWTPCSSHRWECSSPGTAVSPLMPITSYQQTAPSLSMLSNCHTRTILCIMMPSYSINEANLPYSTVPEGVPSHTLPRHF